MKALLQRQSLQPRLAWCETGDPSSGECTTCVVRALRVAAVTNFGHDRACRSRALHHGVRIRMILLVSRAATAAWAARSARACAVVSVPPLITLSAAVMAATETSFMHLRDAAPKEMSHACRLFSYRGQLLEDGFDTALASASARA